MFSNETSCPSLFADLLATRLRQDDLWQHEPAWQHYFGLNGTPDLLDVTANFLQERLAQGMIISGHGWDPSDQGQKLTAEKLRMVNGVSGGLEALAWIISDPGDVVIVPTPTYARWLCFLQDEAPPFQVFCRYEWKDADQGGGDAPWRGLCAHPTTSGIWDFEAEKGGWQCEGISLLQPQQPSGSGLPKTISYRSHGSL